MAGEARLGGVVLRKVGRESESESTKEKGGNMWNFVPLEASWSVMVYSAN